MREKLFKWLFKKEIEEYELKIKTYTKEIEDLTKKNGSQIRRIEYFMKQKHKLEMENRTLKKDKKELKEEIESLEEIFDEILVYQSKELRMMNMIVGAIDLYKK